MTDRSTRVMPPIRLTWLCLFLWGSLAGLQAQRSALILDHKDRVRITPLTTVNSSARETNLSITPDGKMLYFMSLRGGQYWSQKFMTYKGDSVYDGDIWYSRKVNGNWQKPHCMPYGINSSDGEDEPHISVDGKTVYFQSWNSNWQDTGGPYYRARHERGSWRLKEGLGGGITQFFQHFSATDGMAVSPNERIFVVAAGYGYNTPMDIYISRKTSRGWTPCRLMSLSTPGDERSVFIAADNKTIYFASDGYRGLGGLDIFKATLRSDGSVGDVINVGAPFNTPGDDYGFILTADGSEAYFIRDGDIHFADLKEADERMKPTPVKVNHILAGTVRDSATWRGMPAEVILMDARTKRLVSKVQTTASGKYRIELPNDSKTYDQVVYADGYSSEGRRLTLEASGLGKTYTANYVLAKNAPPPVAVIPDPDPEPDPSGPDLAQTETPLDEGTSPSPPSQEKEELQVSKVEPKLRPDAPPVAQPQPAPTPQVEEPEDPYSFEGVAKNNLTLVLDVSSSMQDPNKLPLLKEALRRMLVHMRAEDRISIIAYAGEVNVVLDGVSAADQKTILRAIERLSSSGSTDSKTALRKALRLARENFIPGGNNRIIFATDGSFDVEGLYSLSEKVAGDQMVMTVFSFGKLPGYKIEQLNKLAQKGQGTHAMINRSNADAALLKEAKAVRK